MKRMRTSLEGIRVVTQPMPGSIRAFARRMKSGRICIVINEYLDDEGKKKALDHELEHIRRNDFDADVPVYLIEHAN